MQFQLPTLFKASLNHSGAMTLFLFSFFSERFASVAEVTRGPTNATKTPSAAKIVVSVASQN
jgi:hypothetical protein